MNRLLKSKFNYGYEVYLLVVSAVVGLPILLLLRKLSKSLFILGDDFFSSFLTLNIVLIFYYIFFIFSGYNYILSLDKYDCFGGDIFL